MSGHAASPAESHWPGYGNKHTKKRARERERQQARAEHLATITIAHRSSVEASPAESNWAGYPQQPGSSVGTLPAESNWAGKSSWTWSEQAGSWSSWTQWHDSKDDGGWQGNWQYNSWPAQSCSEQPQQTTQTALTAEEQPPLKTPAEEIRDQLAEIRQEKQQRYYSLRQAGDSPACQTPTPPPAEKFGAGPCPAMHLGSELFSASKGTPKDKWEVFDACPAPPPKVGRPEAPPPKHGCPAPPPDACPAPPPKDGRPAPPPKQIPRKEPPPAKPRPAPPPKAAPADPEDNPYHALKALVEKLSKDNQALADELDRYKQLHEEHHEKKLAVTDVSDAMSDCSTECSMILHPHFGHDTESICSPEIESAYDRSEWGTNTGYELPEPCLELAPASPAGCVGRLAPSQLQPFNGPQLPVAPAAGWPKAFAQQMKVEEQQLAQDLPFFITMGLHLGGLSSYQIQHYQPKYGVVNRRWPFGRNVWMQLAREHSDYWTLFGWGPGKCSVHMEKEARVPWLGCFVVGAKFSKLDAEVGLRKGEPGIGHQYPALFYLTPDEDAIMARYLKNGHLCKNEDIHSRADLFQNFCPCQFNPTSTCWHNEYHTAVMGPSPLLHDAPPADIRPGDEPFQDRLITDEHRKQSEGEPVDRVDDGKAGNGKDGANGRSQELSGFFQNHIPSGGRLLEFHATILGSKLLMVCVKIAIGGSRPWWVNGHHIRLWGPLDPNQPHYWY